jgi:hypothetical protein
MRHQLLPHPAEPLVMAQKELRRLCCSLAKPSGKLLRSIHEQLRLWPVAHIRSALPECPLPNCERPAWMHTKTAAKSTHAAHALRIDEPRTHRGIVILTADELWHSLAPNLSTHAYLTPVRSMYSLAKISCRLTELA